MIIEWTCGILVQQQRYFTVGYVGTISSDYTYVSPTITKRPDRLLLLKVSG